MEQDWLYLRYRSKWLAEKCARKLGVKFHEPAVYAGMPIVPIEQAQAFFKERILSGEPFAAGRFGSVELSAFWHQDAIEPVRPKTKRAVLNEMCCNAGFFPPDERKLEQFSQIMRTACGQMDVFCVWFNPMEDYAIDAYGNPQMITKLRALEPWHPWTGGYQARRYW